MKHAELHSPAHNLANSLGSGENMVVALILTDIYPEAASAAPGWIEADFLT